MPAQCTNVSILNICFELDSRLKSVDLILDSDLDSDLHLKLHRDGTEPGFACGMYTHGSYKHATFQDGCITKWIGDILPEIFFKKISFK